MRSSYWAALLALGTLSLASSGKAAPAMSAPMTLAPEGSQVLSLDASDGQVSAWNRDDLTGVNTVRANITVMRLGGKGDPAGFWITLSNASESLGFVGSGREAKKSLLPMLLHSANPRPEYCFLGGALLSSFDINETVELEINWTATGDMVVFLRNNASRALNNDAERCLLKMENGPPTALEVKAFSSRVEWAPLTVGVTDPVPWP